FFKTLNPHHPNIKCKTLQISSTQTIQKPPFLLNELTPRHHETVKCDRDQKTRVTPYKHPSLQPPQNTPNFLKNPVYLIIGRLSGIG
ncbi:hypothetical protein, partial [Bacillus velezensis]|uniref:hypothetical protein n=1 Tax=Bacillus velezensis TaxID=492670 RepID=UPI001C93002A